MAVLPETDDGHCVSGGAAEPSVHHRRYGGHNYDWQHGRVGGGSGGHLLSDQFPFFLLLLGICRGSHAVFRPVLGSQKREGHQSDFRGDFHLHDHCRLAVCGDGSHQSGVYAGNLHGQGAYHTDGSALYPHRGICLSPAGFRRAGQLFHAGHGAGESAAILLHRFAAGEFCAELGFDLRPLRRAQDGGGRRGCGHAGFRDREPGSAGDFPAGVQV